MESQRSAGSSAPILVKERSLAHSIKAHLCQHIGTLADEERIKNQYARKAAAEFVKSDPLGVYQKDEGDDGKPKKKDPEGNADSRSDKHKGVRTHAHRRKKKEDDIFKSFGKEHDSSAIQEVDGKMIVNYKRYWQSDPDLSRWQQGLVDKSRYDSLLFDVQHKWHEDFQQDRAELVQRHNALFRQRHAVESKELSLKKSSPSVAQLKDLQTQMTEKSPQHRRSRKRLERQKVERPSHLGEMLIVDEMSSLQSSLEKQKTYGEEQICNFIAFILQQFGTLQDAFRKIDSNGSGEVSFHEFSEVVAIMGYRGDIKFVFYRLDLNGNGVLTMTEFLNLRPYMLKEMVRLSQLALINRSKGLPPETNNIWLKKAKVELGECGVLEQVQAPAADQPSKASSKASNTSMDFMESQDAATLRATTPINPGSPDDRSTCGDSVDSPRLSELSPSARRTVNYPDEEPIARQNSFPRPSMVCKSSQMRAVSKRTLSLYVFRNADRHHSGQVVFMTRIPPTMEALLQICGQELRPLVGPAESLLDTDLRPIRSLDEVCKGGTYLLKGKEALDPPPHMFAHRIPVTTPSYRCLKEIEMAAHAEATSRPATSSSRPVTSQASLMGGCSEGSASTMFSAGRIGGPPALSMGSLMSEPPKTLPMHEKDAHWKAEVRLNKHLTHGGKNLPPTHRRYDLWTVLPRPASVPSIGHSSRIDGMHSPAFF